MKIVVAGSRSLQYRPLVNCSITLGLLELEVGRPTEVVHGGAVGVDDLAGLWAQEQGIPVKVFPAAWVKHGKAAGPIRNRQMAEYADALIAVWDGYSPGTQNMITTMRGKGKPVVVVLRGVVQREDR